MAASFDVSLIHSDDEADAAATELLAKRLTDDTRVQVWLAKWNLIPGESRQQGLCRGMEEANTCVICLGEHTPEGWFSRQIELALDRQTREPGFRVIPLFLPNANRDIRNDFLNLKEWVDFTQGFETRYEFHRLVCGIKGIPPGRPPDDVETPDKEFAALKRKLSQLKELQDGCLIGDEVATEYQRKFLDVMLRNGGK